MSLGLYAAVKILRREKVNPHMAMKVIEAFLDSEAKS